MQKKYTITGMSCSGCQKKISEKLNGMEGIKADINLETHTAAITSDHEVDLTTLNKALEEAGNYRLQDLEHPQKEFVSLGIPTWLYGHEPSTPFATHIAKFFENSIREDSILTLAFGGIIYTPGSAGTMQEIFQDAVQNHYLSFGFSSPMVFLGQKYWTEEMPVYPLLQHLMETGRYKNLLLTLTDDIDEVENVLDSFSKLRK